MKTVGIVGNGYVGHAVHVGLADMIDVKVWDIDPDKSPDSLSEVAHQEVIFICVPTPTDIDGVHKLYYVNSAFSQVLRTRKGDPPIFVIKSTVLPGTCDLLSQTYDVPVVSNPEFLSAKTAVRDFSQPASIVLGSKNADALRAIHALYESCFPNVPILAFPDAKTAELIKYARNCFYAVKLAYLNEIAALCRELGLKYDEVKEGLVASGWVNPMHCDVPGPDGKLGFGGACLPKDGYALVTYGEDQRVALRTLRVALDSNRRIRYGDGGNRR